MGVTAGDVAITNPTATLADITTVGDANFGPDGIFVEAANTTFQGLTINGNLDPGDPDRERQQDVRGLRRRLHPQVLDHRTCPAVARSTSTTRTAPSRSYHILNNRFLDGTQRRHHRTYRHHRRRCQPRDQEQHLRSPGRDLPRRQLQRLGHDRPVVRRPGRRRDDQRQLVHRQQRLHPLARHRGRRRVRIGRTGSTTTPSTVLS